MTELGNNYESECNQSVAGSVVFTSCRIYMQQLF